MEKLVRDQVPALMAAAGLHPSPRRAGRDEIVPLLKRKLVEEAQEVLSADDPEAALAELADLYEVMAALMARLGWTETDVLDARRRKFERAGGFDQGLVLTITE